jgi:hypothetical protein
MRVITAVDDPCAVEKILRRLGAGNDLPTGLFPLDAPGPHTCQLCDDAGLMPDYETFARNRLSAAQPLHYR